MTFPLHALQLTMPTRRLPKKKWVSVTIRLIVTVLLFVVLFKSFSWSTLLVTLTHANRAFLLGGLLVGTIGLVLSSCQWQSLLRGERITLGLGRLLKFYVIGIAFSHFLPTGMGGDAVKAVYVGRASGNGVGSASAVVMSRVTGFLGMLLVSLPALLIWHTHFTETVTLWFLLLSMLVGGLICGAVFFTTLLPLFMRRKLVVNRLIPARVLSTAQHISSAIRNSVQRPRSLRVATLFGVLFHITACLNYYVYALALHLTVPLYFYLVAIPFVSLITFLPISINGFGVREGAFVSLFATLHVPVATSLLLAFLVDVQVLFFGVIGGYLYLTMNSSAKAKQELSAQAEQRQQRKQSEHRGMKRSMMREYQSSNGANATDQASVGMSQIGTDASSATETTSGWRSTPAPVAVSEPVAELPLSDSTEVTQKLTPLPPNLDQEQEEEVQGFPLRPYRRGGLNGLGGYSGWSRGRKVLALGGAVLCLLVLLGAFAFYEVAKSGQGVTVYQVGTQAGSQSIGGGGIVYPRQQLVVSYPAAERVVNVLVNAGDQVTANQPLIQLDGSQLKAEIAQAADDLAAAAIYMDNISASGNSVTIAQAKQAYNLAKDKYDALIAKTNSPTLQNDTLVSPINGVVTSVNINSGDEFSSNTPLLTIMDESTLIVRVQVPLSNLGQVHLGQTATVTPSALPNLNFSGTVSAIIPKANPQTDTFEVWIQVANPQKTLLPGMSAFARIQINGKALAVPRLAVLNPDHEGFVFVVRKQHAYIQPVHIAGRSIDTIFVDGGLVAGERVVLVGVNLLQNGQEVRVSHVESNV